MKDFLNRDCFYRSRLSGMGADCLCDRGDGKGCKVKRKSKTVNRKLSPKTNEV